MEVGRYIKFLVIGLPAFGLALPLNFVLVKWAEWSEPLAYALVLCCQVSLNFVMCRLFVFESRPEDSLFAQFIKFFTGIIGFRVLDWLLYLVLLHVGIYFMIAQVMNVLIFSVAKYLFARGLFEGNRKPEAAD